MMLFLLLASAVLVPTSVLAEDPPPADTVRSSTNPHKDEGQSDQDNRPILSARIAEEVTRLQEELKKHQENGEFGNAISTAEQILALRQKHQSGWTDAQGNPSEWYEIGDARRTIEHLRLLVEMNSEQRAELARVRALDDECNARYSEGKFSEILEITQEMLQINQSLLGEDHPNTMESLHNASFALKQLGRLSEAESYYKKALSAERRVLGNQHPETLTTLENLGTLLREQGKLSESMLCHTESLETHRLVLGQEHPSTFLAMHNMAAVLVSLGKFQDAEIYQRAALEGNRRLLGNEHQGTLASMTNLAILLTHLGKYAEAEEYQQEALRGYQRIFGDAHPNTLTALNSLGHIAVELGKDTQAEKLLQKAMTSCKSILGNDHSLTLSVQLNLSNCLALARKSSEAVELASDALDTARRVFGNDHVLTLKANNTMSAALQLLKRFAEAQEYARAALETSRRLLGDEHPTTIFMLLELGIIYLDDGTDFARSERCLREVLSYLEKQRVQVIGDEISRAHYAERLQLSYISELLATVLIYNNQYEEAWNILERGRSRELLDLLSQDGRSLVEQAEARAKQSGDSESVKKLEKALADEQRAKEELIESQAMLKALKQELEQIPNQASSSISNQSRNPKVPEQEIARLEEVIKTKRDALSQASFRVSVQLDGLFPDAKPLDIDTIRNQLDSDELLLAFISNRVSVAILTAPAAGEGDIYAEVIADDIPHASIFEYMMSRVYEQLIEKKDNIKTDRICSALFSKEASEQLRRAKRVIVLPDGPLYQIPFEILLPEGEVPLESGPQWIIAHSASMYLNRKSIANAKKNERPATALVLGNPIYAPSTDQKADPPDSGVLLVSVQPGGVAEKAGLSRGDVLLSYDERTLKRPDSLSRAVDRINRKISRGSRTPDTPIPATYWRQGKTKEIQLQPGDLGITASQDPDIGKQLRAINSRERGMYMPGVDLLALEQRRIIGEDLTPLPGTESEAQVIANTFRRANPDTAGCTLLLGPDATVPKLLDAVSGKRYLHLACHGAMGSMSRPYDACLALTQPQHITPEDFGFLRLQDLISKWQGKLDACELVVLSACDTQRGFQTGTSMMTLPVGFMYAGCPAVLASLWKVDDTATMILMSRFYENLLGTQDQPRSVLEKRYDSREPMNVLDALFEAKRYLRDLTLQQAIDWCEKNNAKQALEVLKRRGDLIGSDSKIYSHPYYWASFVLLGAPSP